MAVLAKLWEEGKVDLDSPVTKYVSDWPAKLVDGKDKFENGIRINLKLTIKISDCHCE